MTLQPHDHVALVVGGRGFLGGFIVSELRKQGWSVRALARPQGRALAPHEIPGDLSRMTDKKDWERVLDGVSVVINAAGILREENTQTFEGIHVAAPLALAASCAKRSIRFVQISALGDPKDGEFIASKHRFDQQLLLLPIHAIVLRPSIVYSRSGSYGGTALLRALAAFPFKHLLPGKGAWRFQPTSAEDLARIVVSACSKGEHGIYDVGSKAPISLERYQSTWRQWLGIEGEGALHVPMLLVNAQVWISQKLGRGPVSQTIWNMLKREHLTSNGAHTAINEQFGVEVRDLEDALAEQPSQTQDRWSAQLYFLAPWLKWSMVILWLLSGLVGLLTPNSNIEALAAGWPLEHIKPVLLARATGVLDIVLALALIFSNRPRWVVMGMLIMAVGYLVSFGAMMPRAWWDPLGGLIKNIAILPALAVLWVLVDRR